MLTLVFPSISPVIVSVGPIDIRWYSMAYFIGIILAFYYGKFIIKYYQNHFKIDLAITTKQLEDFLSLAVIGTIVGGRLGYVIFYDPIKFLAKPIDILKTYEGGMSFHGGFIGVVLAMCYYCWHRKISLLRIGDIAGVCVPICLLLGRIANFINGELYGRETSVPWGMIFPSAGELPRHPSQLYEAALEGIFMLLIISIATFKFQSLKYKGLNSSLFLLLYSLSRVLIENFREPDVQIGFIYGCTMGQILSIPMIIGGIFLMYKALCRPAIK